MWNYSGLTRYRGVLSIIAIIIVAAALIGGGVWVQHRGEVARENGAQVATNAGKGSDTAKNSSSTSQTPPAPAGNNTSTGMVKQPSSSSSSNKNASSSSSKSTGATTGSSSSSSSKSASSQVAQTSSNLPDTGPSDGPMAAIALSLLTFAALSYVNSRRQLSRL